MFNLKLKIMYLNDLQQDNVFVSTTMMPLKKLTRMESRRGLENVIISNGKIVNVVSNRYGHITNQLFFNKAEEMLLDANLTFQKQTINRFDRSFVMEFIIEDQKGFKVKNDKDLILPMLRFKNSYDGQDKTAGHFGFYRKVCSNGLHISSLAEMEFSIRHTKSGIDLLMPKLNELFEAFVENEFYSIVPKFNKMKQVKIIDTKEFVRKILEETELFRYECSDTNSDPSKKARTVIDIINNESLLLGEQPNLWLGYNAFNSVLHGRLKKSFSEQEKLDKKLFDVVYQFT